MKFFILSALLVAAPAVAKDAVKSQKVFTPPPPELVDGKIDVTLKSGNVLHYSENDHKVVSRTQIKRNQANIDELRKELADAKAKLAAAETALAAERAKPAKVETKEVVKETTPADKPNRVTFGLGAGPDGLAVNQSNAGQVVTPRTSAVFSLGYSHKLGDYSPWDLGLQGIGGISYASRTLTGLVNVGYSW